MKFLCTLTKFSFFSRAVSGERQAAMSHHTTISPSVPPHLTLPGKTTTTTSNDYSITDSLC